MIAKGNQHNNGAKLAQYMITGKPGETAELWEMRGFAADNIKDAFRDVQIMAEGTKCEQPFFHVQVRNPTGENLTRDEWERVANRIESKLGLRGQPRAIAFHIEDANGHEHMHLAWSRIDEEKMTAKQMPFFKERLKEVSRELEIKFGLTQVTSDRKGPIKFAPTRAEDEQARRLGLDPEEVRNTIRDCYDRSDCGASFQAALEQEALILAQGDRRGSFVVIDQAGGIHALGKRILDVTAPKLREHLSDLVREELPTVENARALVPGYEHDAVHRLKEELADVQKQIETERMAAISPEERDHVIYAALLHQAIRNPHLTADVQTLAWKMPAEFAVELTESLAAAQEVQARNLKLPDIDRLIIERQTQAFKSELAAIDRLQLDGERAPALAYVPVAQGQREHDAEAARLDELISTALLQQAIRNPHLADQVQMTAWRMPTEFVTRFSEQLAAAQGIQARNLELSDIDRLITAANRDEQKRHLDETDKTIAAAFFEHWKKYPNRYQTHWQDRVTPGIEAEIEKLKAIDAERQYAQRDPGRDDMAWDDALTKAAIEKERKERLFVEPEIEEKNTVGSRKKDVFVPARRPLSAAADIRLAYFLSHSPEGFVQNLEERGFQVAHVTADEAERSRTAAGFAREIGRFAPEFHEGDYVAINQRGNVYALNRSTTGAERGDIESFMGTLNPMNFDCIDSVQQRIEAKRQSVWKQRMEKEQQREKEQQLAAKRPLKKEIADIRLAYSLSQSPDSFAKNLDECGIKLACATKEEAERSQSKAAFAKAVGRFAPEYREGEYVAINERGHVYSLNRSTTGDSREDVEAFMRTIDATNIQGIEEARQHIAAYKRPAPARELFPAVSDVEGQAIRMPSHAQPLNTWQQFGYAAAETTQRDHAPEHLQGSSADIWTAFIRSDNARAFVAALKEQNITIAVVSREDVINSEIDRTYATNLQPAPTPKLREGDYVAVTDDARVYNLNPRTTGEAAERVLKFMATLDRKEFQGVYTVLNDVQERAALHDTGRQAFRDLSAGALKKPKDLRPTGWLGLGPLKGNEPNYLNLFTGPDKVAISAARSVGKVLDVVADAFESFFAPPLTPEQVYEGEKSDRQRDADAAHRINFFAYTAELSQQRQQEENEREAARQRERDAGGRER